MTIETLRRTGGPHKGEAYGYQCSKCGASWKVYQQETHYGGCLGVAGRESCECALCSDGDGGVKAK